MILKRKYRHVLVLSSGEVDAKGWGLNAGLMRIMGELSYSEANPRVVSQCAPDLFIIRVNRGFEKRLILSLSFVKEVNGKRLGFCTVKTSGTIKSLLEYAKAVKG